MTPEKTQARRSEPEPSNNPRRILARLEAAARKRRDLRRRVADLDGQIRADVREGRTADVPVAAMAEALGVTRPAVYDLLKP